MWHKAFLFGQELAGCSPASTWTYTVSLAYLVVPHDPAILLLSMYLEKTIIWKDTCIPTYIHSSTICTIAKTWKQPKCPLTEEWTKVWYIYAMEYYSAIKKDEIMSFSATWMDLEIIIWSQRKTNTIWYHFYAESKIWYKWIYLQNTNRFTGRADLWLPRVGWGRERLGVWD